jgi:hypothetical protein
MGIVQYFEREELPGVQHFRCDKLMATLAVRSCADMWRKANHDNVERLARCKTCPLGAAHAGETAASMSPFMGATVCARCQRTATRLIGKHLDVSCYNRQLEYIKGKNAKGSQPTKMRPLARRTIRYFAADDPTVLTIDHTANTEEMMVAALRDSKKQVTFAFYGMPRGIAQERLF